MMTSSNSTSTTSFGAPSIDAYRRELLEIIEFDEADIVAVASCPDKTEMGIRLAEICRRKETQVLDALHRFRAALQQRQAKASF